MSDGLKSDADTMGYPEETKCDDTPIASGLTPAVVGRNVSRSATPHFTDPELSAEDLNSLGRLYLQWFRGTGTRDHLDDAIVYLSRAVASTPHGDPNLPNRQTDLGIAYTDRFERYGELEDIEKSITHICRALTLTPDGHPHMSYRLSCLGVSYGDRFRRLGELNDLQIAILHFSHALALTPDDHPDMSLRHADLGVSYGERFRRLAELDDLENAIICLSHALALTPDGHPEMSCRLGMLGMSYADRFRRLGELADLEKAIECDSRALASTPDGHPDMSRRLASLGASYRHRFQCLGELADLEKSIDCRSRALALTPDGHPEMPHHLTILGNSYRDRYKRLGERVDLEKSMEYNSRALALSPDGHPDLPPRHFNQGLNLLDQYQHTSHPSHLHHSLDSFRSASQLLTGSPRANFLCALGWADLASELSALNPMEAYQTAIDLLPQFIWLGATANQRYQDLSMAEGLAVNACFAAIQSSNYPLALEWLEHARCVVWNQSLMLRSPLDQLHSSHPDLATRLEAIANQLNSSSFEAESIPAAPLNSITPERAGKQRRHLASEYHDLLAQTHELSGFEDFLQPMKAKGILSVVRGGPVIVINCHTDRCDALFILPGHEEIAHLPLPNFTEDKARQARSELTSSLMQKGLRRPMSQIGDEDEIESVLQILWDDIVKPVLDHLGYMDDVPPRRLPHVTWCLTGPLSFLPIHAAGDYSQTQSRIFDYVVSSYIPTLSALSPSTPSSLNRNCRVLAVGQAATPGHNPLPGTIEELAHVKRHMHNKAEYMQLIDSEATTTAVLDAMEHHDWVHLACHAHQNFNDPAKSGFYLHDDTLDLASINQRSFKNKGLAFLSACQTATGDEMLPDEAIHLASGMLMAGYPSVIATMWSVGDNDAPLVADKVYAQLMKDGKVGNGEAGRALHYAVAALRDKVGEKAFGSWVPYIHIGS
ncbi:hypothetical protein RSAG8_06330, partial [Rhizoctonia solani AG-8 WAC10335]